MHYIENLYFNLFKNVIPLSIGLSWNREIVILSSNLHLLSLQELCPFLLNFIAGLIFGWICFPCFVLMLSTNLDIHCSYIKLICYNRIIDVGKYLLNIHCRILRSRMFYIQGYFNILMIKVILLVKILPLKVIYHKASTVFLYSSSINECLMK